MDSEYKDDVELISFHSVSKGTSGECGLRGGYHVYTNIHEGTIAQMYKVRYRKYRQLLQAVQCWSHSITVREIFTSLIVLGSSCLNHINLHITNRVYITSIV